MRRVEVNVDFGQRFENGKKQVTKSLQVTHGTNTTGSDEEMFAT